MITKWTSIERLTWQTTHQFELDILAVTAYVSIRLENYCREVVWMGMHSVRLEMASKVVVPHMSEVWAKAQRVYSPLCEVVFKPQKTVKAMLMKVKEKVVMEGRETLCMWSTSVRQKNNEKETDGTLICCEVGRSVEYRFAVHIHNYHQPFSSTVEEGHCGQSIYCS